MARVTYVFDCNPDGTLKRGEDGRLIMVEKSKRQYSPRVTKGSKGSHMVIEDIQPYVSTIDGSVISSRSKHNRHLREHGCVEIGNESVESAQKHFQRDSREDDRKRKEAVIRAVNEALR